jgi:hypothetical protein
MKMLTIQTATSESAHGLYNALWAFHPELDKDDEGESIVSVELGSDRQVHEIFDALDLHRDSLTVDPAISSVATVSGDPDRSFSLA